MAARRSHFRLVYLMDCDPSFRMPQLIRLALFAFALLLATRTAQAQIDAGLNSTVWKMLYGVTDAQVNDPAWLARDDDGDGVSNGAELAAGTHPFNAASRFAVTTTAVSDSTVTLSLPTVAGKVYVLQTSANLADPTSWATVSPGVQVTGDGTTKTLTAPRGAAAAFYRVAVQDVDTDGDGVSDWAELAVGLDPASTHTHGAALDDHATLAADLAGKEPGGAGHGGRPSPPTKLPPPSLPMPPRPRPTWARSRSRAAARCTSRP